MQNIVRETLQAGESLRAAGAKYLLVRDATNTLTLRIDTLEPVEVKKNDVVSIAGSTIVELSNHHASAVTVEYQITDLAINTQSEAMAVSGAVSVDEINKPIVVSAIQNAVAVANFPDEQRVRVANLSELKVEVPDIEVSMPDELEISNLPDVQKVEVTNPVETAPLPKRETNGLPSITINRSDQSTPENSERQVLIAIAPESNQGDIILAGFIPLKAGGSTTIVATNALSITGTNGDVLLLGEEL